VRVCGVGVTDPLFDRQTRFSAPLKPSKAFRDRIVAQTVQTLKRLYMASKEKGTEAFAPAPFRMPLKAV